MNRRILDVVSVKAINECGDEALKKQVFDLFGAGTLVKDAKTPTVRFDKSMFGLKKNTVAGAIQRLAKELIPTVDDCKIIDSMGGTHCVSKEAVAILKAIVIYTTSCPVPVADCMNSLFSEIDSILRNGSSEELVTIIVEQDNEGDFCSSSNKNLLIYCRNEVFELLREAGVNIE